MVSEGETPGEGERNEQGRSEEGRFFCVEPSEHRGGVDDPGR